MSNIHLCRAKRLDNIEWVVGHYYEFHGKHFIFEQPFTSKNLTHEVDPSTICQGMTVADKTIWENALYNWDNPGYGKCTGIIRVGEWLQDGSGNEYPPIHCYGFYVKVLKVEPFPGSCMEEDDYPEYLKTISVFEMFENNSNIKLIGNAVDDMQLIEPFMKASGTQ